MIVRCYNEKKVNVKTLLLPWPFFGWWYKRYHRHYVFVHNGKKVVKDNPGGRLCS